MNLLLYFDILWNRRFLILLVVSLTLVAALGFTTLRPEVYQATATLRVLPYSTSSADYQVSYSDRVAKTFIERATSDAIKIKLMERLGLKTDPEYSIESVSGTELIEVSALDSTPAEALRITETLTAIILDPNEISQDGGGGASGDAIGKLIEETQQGLNQLEAQHRTLLAEANLDLAEIDAVAQQITAAERSLDLLQDRYTLALLARTVRDDAISLVQSALLPEFPESPSALVILVLGGVVGFAAGVMLAFVAEAADTRVYQRVQIEALRPASVLGSIPTIPRKARGKLVVNHASTEAFRRLAFTLAKPPDDEKCQILLVSSAQPREGKSTLVANLAQAFTQQGYKTLVIDWDLRRPSLHTFFGFENNEGLSNIYAAYQSNMRDTFYATVQRLIRRSSAGIYVLTAGLPVTDLRGIFRPDFSNKLLNVLVRECDVILIDTPALMAAADVLALVGRASGVLLAAQRGTTSRAALQNALDNLEQCHANLLGIVLNQDTQSGSYKWYGYYQGGEAAAPRSHSSPPKAEQEHVSEAAPQGEH